MQRQTGRVTDPPYSKRQQSSVPMLYVKHSPDEVIALFDDVRLLKQGRIERRGAPKDLFVIATDAPRYRRRA